jgi:hypothetical protein
LKNSRRSSQNSRKSWREQKATVNKLTFDICPDGGLGFLRHNGALFRFGVHTFQRGRLAHGCDGGDE